MSARRKTPEEGETKGRTTIPPALRILPLTYRVDDAALALGVSERKVWRLIQERKIPSRKIEGSTVILASDLRDYVEALPIVNAAQ